MTKTKCNFLLFFLTLLVAISCLLPTEVMAKSKRTEIFLRYGKEKDTSKEFCLKVTEQKRRIVEDGNKIEVEEPGWLSQKLFGDANIDAEFCYDKEDMQTYRKQGNRNVGCVPYPVKVKESGGCFLCPLFKVVYDAMNKVATQSFKTFGKPMSFVVSIAIALAIGLTTLPHVSSFGAKTSDKYLNAVLVWAFKLIIVFTLLNNPDAIYDLFVIPVLMTGLDFGQAMLVGDDIAPVDVNLTTTTGLLSTQLYAKLEQYLTNLQDSLRATRSIGSVLMCNGLKSTGILPDLGMMVQGVIIYIVCLLLIISFGFYLIDTVVQIGIVGAMIPFCIACWPFKKTKKFTDTGFNMFMNSFFNFVCMGVVIRIVCDLIKKALDNQTVKNLVYSDESETGHYVDSTVTEVLEGGGSISAIGDAIDLFSVNFLILLCACIFAYKFAGTASQIAGKFSGVTAFKPIGSEIGGMAVSAAVKPGKAAVGAAKAGVKNKLNQAFANGKQGKATARAAR